MLPRILPYAGSTNATKGAGALFHSLADFQAIIAKGTPRHASDGEERKKGQTMVWSECKGDEKLAYEKMMGQCISLAHPGVTCEDIRHQVHQ